MNQDHIAAALARRVRQRAGDRCEYCLLSQRGQEATFHIDHVEPRRAGGRTRFENLALACVSCSLRKGGRTHGRNPPEGEAALFNPRRDSWKDHFAIDALLRIEGKTATGRVTVEMLQMNRPLVVAIRREERARSRFPP
jgi:hypothetical protein